MLILEKQKSNASPKTLIGIKGRIQTRDVELEDEIHKKYVEVIAEKVTFLSSKKADE
jgi:single-stranded DNA-binding protein